jgi:tetratricopeptide (TPR) repeat protein
LPRCLSFPIYLHARKAKVKNRIYVSISAGLGIFLLLVCGFVPALGAHDVEKPDKSAAKATASSAGTQAANSSATPTTESSSSLAVALHLYRTGKYDAAIEHYNAIIKAGPDSNAAVAEAWLARVYLKEKKPAEAYVAAAKAVELAPQLATARSALGEVYFRQGKIGEAELEFLNPLRANMQDARAYFGLTRIYRATSNYKRAKVVIDLAHKTDPDDPEIRRVWIGTLSFKERLKALEDYLSEESNEDAEDRKSLEHLLVVMQDEENNPSRSCRLKSNLKATETKLVMLMADAKRLRGYGLNVKINGNSSNLLLDTGAGGILINSKLAEKAGIRQIVQREIKGIGDKGPAGGYVGYADSITIGELEFENCHVDVIEKKSSMGEDGLIGADVFSHYLVDINLPDAKFKLTELPPIPDEPAEEAALDSRRTAENRLHDRYIAPEMKSYTPIYRFGHHLLIPTAVNDLPSKLFNIDTGAFDNMITPAAGREVSKVFSDDYLKVKGLSGEVKNVYRADNVTLSFAHFRQKRQGLVAFDLTTISNSLGTEVSGTLGFGMLRMLDMKIDYRDGLVDFSFDANRFH